ncbi:MAG: SGNH/GDSL hydrolase family protein [Sedimenticola sp.]
MGDSLVHWAHKQAMDQGIQNLHLADEYKVQWFGQRGMHWENLMSVIQRRMLFGSHPVIILIHLGTNDIDTIPIATFKQKIEKDLQYLFSTFLETKIVWSDIFPRVAWKTFPHMMRKLARINRVGRVSVDRQTYGLVLNHNIDWDNVQVFRPDGIHLSETGNKQFIAELSDVVRRSLGP